MIRFNFQLKELPRGRRIFNAARVFFHLNTMPRTIHRTASQPSAAPLLAAHDREVITEPLNRIPGGLPPEAVAAYAYHIWEQEGRPVGRDREHWLQAEAQLRWALLADELTGTTSQNRVRRKLWDQSTARFGPEPRASRPRRPAGPHAR